MPSNRGEIWTVLAGPKTKSPNSPRTFTRAQYLEYLRARRVARDADRRYEAAVTRANTAIRDFLNSVSTFEELASHFPKLSWAFKIILNDPHFELSRMKIDAKDIGEGWKIKMEYEGRFTQWRKLERASLEYKQKRELIDMPVRDIGVNSMMSAMSFFGIAGWGQCGSEYGEITADVHHHIFPGIAVMNILRAPPRRKIAA